MEHTRTFERWWLLLDFGLEVVDEDGWFTGLLTNCPSFWTIFASICGRGRCWSIICCGWMSFESLASVYGGCDRSCTYCLCIAILWWCYYPWRARLIMVLRQELFIMKYQNALDVELALVARCSSSRWARTRKRHGGSGLQDGVHAACMCCNKQYCICKLDTR
jgi:hypothetical protein